MQEPQLIGLDPSCRAIGKHLIGTGWAGRNAIAVWRRAFED
jgi:hypothetical protein